MSDDPVLVAAAIAAHPARQTPAGGGELVEATAGSDRVDSNPVQAGTVLLDLQPQKIELLIRITLQNVLLVVASCGFAGFAAVALTHPSAAWGAAGAHAIVSGALLLQWCHHGVRTMQIKAFIVKCEAGLAETWETWLPAHRPARILGTRWLISTKGVFLGLQVAMAGLALAIGEPPPVFAVFFCAAAGAATAGFLFSNPKE